MGIVTALHHVTAYSYDRPIQLGMQTIRLRPAPHARADIQSYSLKIEPENHFLNWQQDPFGNFLARVVFPERTTKFSVTVDVVSEIKVFNPFDFFLEPEAESIPFSYEAGLREELAPYLEIKESGELLNQYLSALPQPKATVNWLVEFNMNLNQLLGYTIRLEPGVQTCEQTLSLKSGSCRDMAWLACQLLRHRGLATRFASGYLIQLKADQKSLDGPSGTEEDFTDLHAWCEVYLPGAGWVGIDPTSGLFTGEGHIPLCCTPSPTSAAPISGTLEACESTLHHEMTIERIYESRRVTKPFTDPEWKRIDALGEKVDVALEAQDVRLTMGGEPTFVSLDDRTGSEWHFTALSDAKKKLGHDIFRRVTDKFANKPLLQNAQGKWYPGELLPRWAMNAYWRRDGEPVWLKPDLLADPDAKGGLKRPDARRFLETLTAALGLDSGAVIDAYEDIPYALWKEQRIPLEGEMLKADVFEATERKRLQAQLDSNLGKPTGYVLPLAFSAKTDGWLTNKWAFRPGRMMLIPGDSPVGLRLPLSQLPVVEPELAEPHQFPDRSPFAATEPLKTSDDLLSLFARRLSSPSPFTGKVAAKPTEGGNTSNAAIAPSVIRSADDSFPVNGEGEDINGLIRSALCAEVRNGTLFLFLPPLTYAEHYFELISAIEAVAQHLSMAVVIEGYGPPRDHRIESMSVTPDPGVIEVNIQPARSWAELSHIINTVYDEARQARLVADKFMIDGKRVGTGGGNHIVMGAEKPEDSPFLRRPDVLASMITFWQTHPSLSYLFSGMYIGPTSQAPRIDEARHDSLYELEIALSAIPEPGSGECPPWMVDRLLRNMLVDLTGNTHRAEFCIDKLYSPDSDRGRLGLLEMRGFEMSPHPQMNLIQNLLIRALVATFWRKPFKARLVRWGTLLHDKFMLSHYVREDLNDVLDYLSANGFKFSPDWFVPFFDFRFPSYGKVQVGGLSLELRSALEPWPVMGEETSGGATSRAVDSSVERLEVTVTGAVPGHHVITCNGRRVPLHGTRDLHTQVAGVRYKAWAPHSALHPNLPVDSPLMFDVIDARLERSIGGCRYHVMHPGGRSYEELPLNENEAEGRMLSRFEAPTHTPGRLRPPPVRINPDFPHTLDLRWPE